MAELNLQACQSLGAFNLLYTTHLLMLPEASAKGLLLISSLRDDISYGIFGFAVEAGEEPGAGHEDVSIL